MMFFILIWSLSSLAFFTLASSMQKHQKQIFGETLQPKMTNIYRILAWLLLIFTLILCCFKAQLSNMISYWIGVLSFSALFVGLSLSYYPSHIKKLFYILLFSTFISGLNQFILH